MTNKKLAAIIAAIVLAGVAVVLTVSGLHTTNKPAVEAKPTAVANTQIQSTQDLSVGLNDLFPDKAKCRAGDGFVRDSIDAPGRRWSDSVSTPFKASAKEGMLDEVLAENCVNPTLLDQNIQALSNITLDGVNVGQKNTWMAGFLAKAKTPGLRQAFLTKKVGKGDAIFVTASLQQYAAATNSLLIMLQNTGVVTQTSLTNYHLPAGGLVTGELQRVVLNPHQEGLPVLRLDVTEKGRGCVFALGFNTQDKRFETLACEIPKPPKKQTTTTPPASGGCKVNCGTTVTTPPSGGCVTNCGPTPVCKEIAGNGIDDCHPKSGDKRDYIYPPGKPSVTVQGPAEKSPTPVATTQTGGRGRVDTPTNPPGSESGVTAPGATPAPTSSPSPTQPPQGGNDDTGDQTNGGSEGGLP